MNQEKSRRLEHIQVDGDGSNCLLVMAEAIAHVGYWRFNLVAGDLFWSNETKRIYGYDLDYTPTLEAALNAYLPDERERISALLQAAIDDGQPFSFESFITKTDGTIRDVVSSGNVERDADGAVIGVLGVFQDVTGRKNAERERDSLLERFTLATKAGRIGIWDYHIATGARVWDQHMFELYAIDPSVDSIAEAWRNALDPRDRERVFAEMAAALAGEQEFDTEFRIVWPNGAAHTIRSLATVVRDAHGIALRMVGTIWDVTEVRTLAEALRSEKDALSSSEARYRALTEAIPQIVWVIDSSGRMEYVNARWTQYTGYTLEQIRKLGRDRTIAAEDVALVSDFQKRVPAKEFECEVRLRRRDGAFRWHLFRSVPFKDADGPGKWIVSATDIEGRKNAEVRLAQAAAELAHIAHHDPMTNLPNRKLLMDRLSQAIALAARTATGVMVLYLDLDRFKIVNDQSGHAAGDRVLAQTAVRITQALRAGDTASRVGGDEFILVCARQFAGEDAALLARRLLTTISEPIEIDGGTSVTVGASIGISLYPGDDVKPDGLIRKADAAMYLAKQSGRNAFRAYVPELDAALAGTLQFETDMRTAILEKQFIVYYQPMISLHSGRLIGAEALVRWRHPERGLLQPGDFIPFAEDHGFVAQIGELVLHQSCAQLQRLDLDAKQEFSLAINVCAQQFQQSDFVPSLAAAIALHSTDVTRLEIEITESTLMGNTATTIGVLHDLKGLGVKLSLDDFGTGYSSLSYLKNFPIDTLKIDRSFVRDVASNRTDQALAKTIIMLAHSLGMRVVSEGVETRAQLDTLRRFGCDSCQGYFISQPLPAAQFESFIKTFEPLAPLPAFDI